MRKYQFGSELDCIIWLAENYPAEDDTNTESVALADFERPVHRPIQHEG